MSEKESEHAAKWFRSETRLAIERKFRFSSRSQAWGFVARVACLLDTSEFSVEWSNARVKVILTWEEGEPTDASLNIANEINDLL
jgi:pterin-4a-carbinolamine dehydratase